MRSAAGFLKQKVAGEPLPELTLKEAFEIVRSKAFEGWKAVKAAMRERATQKT